jgi:hypothetical protein
MMPLALLLVGLELGLLSWLIPEVTEAEIEDRKLIIPGVTDRQALSIEKSTTRPSAPRFFGWPWTRKAPGHIKSTNPDLSELP